MIIDSSAVLAVLLHEADAERYAAAILTAAPCRMSAANALETFIYTLAHHRCGFGPRRRSLSAVRLNE